MASERLRSVSGLPDMAAAEVRTLNAGQREEASDEPEGRNERAECSGMGALHVRIGCVHVGHVCSMLIIRHHGLRRRCGVQCGSECGA